MAVRACSARSSAPRPAARSAPRSTATTATYAAAKPGQTPDEGRPHGGRPFSFASEREREIWILSAAPGDQTRPAAEGREALDIVPPQLHGALRLKELFRAETQR